MLIYPARQLPTARIPRSPQTAPAKEPPKPGAEKELADLQETVKKRDKILELKDKALAAAKRPG